MVDGYDACLTIGRRRRVGAVTLLAVVAVADLALATACFDGPGPGRALAMLAALDGPGPRTAAAVRDAIAGGALVAVLAVGLGGLAGSSASVLPRAWFRALLAGLLLPGATAAALAVLTFVRLAGAAGPEAAALAGLDAALAPGPRTVLAIALAGPVAIRTARVARSLAPEDMGDLATLGLGAWARLVRVALPAALPTLAGCLAAAFAVACALLLHPPAASAAGAGFPALALLLGAAVAALAALGHR